MKSLKLAFKFFGIFIKSQISYLSDFFLWLVIDVMRTSVRLVFAATLIGYFSKIGGWNKWELAFFLGCATISQGLFDIFFFNLLSLGTTYLHDGSIDTWLVRPKSVLLQLVTDRLDLDNCGSLLLGALIIRLSIQNLDLQWSLFNTIWVLFSIGTGVVLLFGLFLCLSSLSFWFDEKSSFPTILYSTIEMSRYPLDIFPKTIMHLFTYVFPLGSISYYPILLLLRGKTEINIISFLGPLFAIFSVGVGMLIWNHGLKRYQSTGS